MYLNIQHNILSVIGICLVTIVLTGPMGVAMAADPVMERGQKLFKKCIHCHTYKRNQAHRIGPNLFGMFGRKAGAVADFDFSTAWKNADFIWTDKTLDTYLTSPRKMIPNNRMPFDGLSRQNDRHALITYLKTIVAP